jgi:GNAT superfamily N-acetyltransferase
VVDDDIEVCPADASRWDSLAELFGRAGASNGCWCQYWILGAEYHRRDRASNRADLKAEISSGMAGLLAFRQGRPVGWARVCERDELGWLSERFPKYHFSGTSVIALPCLYVRPSDRGTGVMTALVSGAVDWARVHRKVLQAYPIDPSVERASRNRFTGVLPSFLAAGFTEVGRLATDRPVVEWAGTGDLDR